jgi:translation initiation factor 2D
MGGADLFLQGFIQSPPEWLANQIHSICVQGNPVPFAVGKMCVSKVEAGREGMKGRGVQVMHTYGDFLYQLGSKMAPNDGFLPNKIIAIDTIDKKKGGEDDNNNNREVGDNNEQQQGVDLTELETLALNESSVTVGEEEGEVEDTGVNINNNNNENTEALDALITATAIGGLHSLTTGNLPMQISDFYTKHMIVLKPDNVTFDFKKSSFRKLSKLLDVLETDKLITQKNIRKQSHIVSIDRLHPRYVGWATQSINRAAGAFNASGSSTAVSDTYGGDDINTSTDSNITNNSEQLNVVFKWKAPSSLRPIFGDLVSEEDLKNRLFTKEETDLALYTYAKANNLITSIRTVGGGGSGGEGRAITAIELDRLLRSTLFDKKEPEEEGSAVGADNMEKRLRKRMQAHYALMKGDTVVVLRKGLVPQVIGISAEKRRGRSVTSVTHVEAVGLDAEETSKLFQKTFKTACSIYKLPGNNETDFEILMQGDSAIAVAEWFKKVHGVPDALLKVSGGQQKKKGK